MVYKRKRVTAPRTRRIRRKYKGKFKRRYYMPRAARGGFPTFKKSRHRYVQEITLNAAANDIDKYVFRANCMYDPSLTGIGHQPMGFDQHMQFYDHFTVIGSRIKVQFVDANTSVSNPPFFGVLLSDNGTRSTDAADVNSLLEQWGTGRVVQAGRVYGPQMSTYQTAAYKKFSAKRFFHKKAIVGSADYRGSATASPNEQAYFEVFVASAAGLDPGEIKFLVTIDYICVYTERKPIAGS